MVEHRSAESEGLRFDSSWGLRIVSLSRARDKTNKHLSLSTKVVIETKLEDENSLNDIGY